MKHWIILYGYLLQCELLGEKYHSFMNKQYKVTFGDIKFFVLTNQYHFEPPEVTWTYNDDDTVSTKVILHVFSQCGTFCYMPYSQVTCGCRLNHQSEDYKKVTGYSCELHNRSARSPYTLKTSHITNVTIMTSANIYSEKLVIDLIHTSPYF